MVFTNAQHQSLGSDWDVWRDGLIYLSQWNQHIDVYKRQPLKRVVTEDGTAQFFYIKPGKYYARLFVDTNRNGI